MAAITETFCIYHVTAPGMEPGADELPDDFVYPTMDQLSEQVSTFNSTSLVAVFIWWCLSQITQKLGTPRNKALLIPDKKRGRAINQSHRPSEHSFVTQIFHYDQVRRSLLLCVSSASFLSAAKCWNLTGNSVHVHTSIAQSACLIVNYASTLVASERLSWRWHRPTNGGRDIRCLSRKNCQWQPRIKEKKERVCDDEQWGIYFPYLYNCLTQENTSHNIRAV